MEEDLRQASPERPRISDPFLHPVRELNVPRPESCAGWVIRVGPCTGGGCGLPRIRVHYGIFLALSWA